ncbi:MAG: hypothetical protein ACJ74T_22240 [Pyrinomonadaceae bacterium]
MCQNVSGSERVVVFARDKNFKGATGNPAAPFDVRAGNPDIIVNRRLQS